jgi:hypothetical protein
MFYCYNTKNTTLWEKFQNPIEYSVHIAHTQIYDLSLSMARYRHFNKKWVGWVRVARSVCFCVAFCRSLFVLLLVFFWPLCCLSFVDLRIFTTPLVSSNSS